MRRVLLDTNLLVLLVVGDVDRRLIRSHKRLSGYREIDYDLLQGQLSGYQGMILCPNTLTEASSLLVQISGPAKDALRLRVKALTMAHTEQYISSQQAMYRQEYLRLGLTDAALLTALRPGVVLLTVDLDLHVAALSLGLESRNFNNVRD